MATITVFIDKELDIAEFMVQGVLTYQELRGTIEQYYKGTLTKYTVWDFTDTDIQKIWKNQVLLIGRQVDIFGNARDKCFDVIIAPDIIHYGLAMIYASYFEIIHRKPDSVKTMVFRSREDAFAWIRENSEIEKIAVNR
jgi:hypothetical protein